MNLCIILEKAKGLGLGFQKINYETFSVWHLYIIDFLKKNIKILKKNTLNF